MCVCDGRKWPLAGQFVMLRGFAVNEGLDGGSGIHCSLKI